MLKKHFMAVFVLISLGALVVLGNSPKFISNLFESVRNNLTAKPSTEKSGEILDKTNNLPETPKVFQNAEIGLTENSSSIIPLQVTYLFLFKRLAAFEEKAAEAEAKGEDGSRYRDLYKRLANLSDAQADLLMRTALDCAAKVKLKDETAKQVAARLRALLPPNLPIGQAPMPLPPSPELTVLQQQRDEIILQHRETLKAGLGEDFAKFEAFVHSRITSNITPDLRSRARFPRSVTRNSNANSQPEIKEENK